MPEQNQDQAWIPAFIVGFGMAMFLVCIPFKEITSNNWARLLCGTIGLMMWFSISIPQLIARSKNKPANG